MVLGGPVNCGEGGGGASQGALSTQPLPTASPVTPVPFCKEAPGIGLAGRGVWFGLQCRTRKVWPSLWDLEKTNNQAELMAYIAAQHAVPSSQPLHVVKDNKHVLDGATLYMNRCFVSDQASLISTWVDLGRAFSTRRAPNGGVSCHGSTSSVTSVS